MEVWKAAVIRGGRDLNIGGIWSYTDKDNVEKVEKKGKFYNAFLRETNRRIS